MKKANIFTSIAENLEKELFEEILTNAKLKIERIVSYGHTSPEAGWYNQESDEWVILLEGEAVLSFENEADVRLKKGDYINIPAYTKHRVSWTLPKAKTIWLAVHY
jgi:cupin 2 domain-containing protein